MPRTEQEAIERALERADADWERDDEYFTHLAQAVLAALSRPADREQTRPLAEVEDAIVGLVWNCVDGHDPTSEIIVERESFMRLLRLLRPTVRAATARSEPSRPDPASTEVLDA